MVVNDNYESVTCRICGEQCKRIYGKHLKFTHNNMTTEEYKRLYPGAPIAALSDKISTSKNSGQFMKQDKYRKMYSDKIKGDKNPNHKSNTTEQDRKSRSPFSKEFIKYEGIENIEEHVSNFAKLATKDRISNTNLQYYLNRGYEEKVAIKMLSNRQRTFTLEKCIEEYGEEIGLQKWKDRQEKWQRSLLENGNMKCGYSKVSQDLFYILLKEYSYECMKNVYFATKNKEYYISRKGCGFFVYDFTDIDKKKIIEYNGDCYHANPKIYKKDDYPHPFYKKNGPSAEETWKRDELKMKIAIENGFDVLTIWDSDYRKDKNETIKKCLNFLQSA